MDNTPTDVRQHVGQHINALPTPSLILSEHVLRENCQKMLHDVEAMGWKFRVHVKTLKSLEVTRIMLGDIHKRAVASTLREIKGLLSLAEGGRIEEILYGLPCVQSAIPQLIQFSQKVRIQLLVDHEEHITFLENFRSASKDIAAIPTWQVFIKLDMGGHRAGVDTKTDIPRLKSLISKVENSDAVELYGFYSHAGHSYGCRDVDSAADILKQEIEAGLLGVDLMEKRDKRVVVSIGATPTAHVVRKLELEVPGNVELELHAGKYSNYPANDLQQVSTSSVTTNQQSLRLHTEIISLYPGPRNEAMINSGLLALGRESSAIPGFAQVVGHPNWHVGRMSQEHGVLVRDRLEPNETGEVKDGQREKETKVEEVFKYGEKIRLWVQHACITAAGYDWLFVVDENDIVRDVWNSWRGW